MVRLQMVVAAVVIAAFCSNAEARGRRFYQPTYQYYPTTVQSAPVVQQNVVTQPAATTQATTAPQTTGVVQTNGTEAGNGVVQASATTAPAESAAAPAKPATTTPAPAPAAVGSAQWKAEQCARMGSVQHLGGGFGGGSYEGCGFGATPQQAIQGACFWGQRTPIEIGVARGANGYYSTIFYR